MKETTIEDELREGKTVVYYTVGVSMRPLLVERETHVVIKPINILNGKNFANDKDILLYIRRNGDYVLHRLIQQDEDYFFMRGDNTLGLERIKKSQAIGVVERIYKNGQYIDVDNDSEYKAYVERRIKNYPVRSIKMRAFGLARKVLRVFRGKKHFAHGARDNAISQNLKAAHDMLYLVQCVLNGEAANAAKLQTSLSSIYKMSARHSLDALVSFAINDSSELKNDPVYPAFIESRNKSLTRTAMFDIERQQLENYLEENKIAYMPMKGILLKDLYPKPAMRQMADNDIWYDATRQKDVSKWFFDRGYSGIVGKAVEDTFKKEPMFNFEMHTALYGFAHDRVWMEYYEEKTKHLLHVPEKNYEMRFSDEDFYVYIISHEYKHYSGGGTGLRSLVDCYLLLKKYGKTLDREYVEGELAKLGLLDFEKLIRSLSLKLFDGAKHLELTAEEEKTLNYILLSGVYGNHDNLVKNKLEMIRANELTNGDESTNKSSTLKAKLRFLRKWMFPTREFMNHHYHTKYFWQLPFAYVYRWIILGLPNTKLVISELLALAKAKE